MARLTESIENQIAGRKLVQALHVHLRFEKWIHDNMIPEVRATGGRDHH